MSIIEECARPVDKNSIKGIPAPVLINLYKTMVKIRLVEDYIGRLVSGGKIKTPCHLYIGQEAVAAGICAHLKKDDLVFSTHRSHGHYIAKGGGLNGLMAEVFGKVTGCSRGRGGSMHIASLDKGLLGSSAIVGGTVPLAVGAALSFFLQNKKSVSLSFFGDGATNEGVLYESLNFASLKKLPVIFVCENNFYSTHMHISKIQSIMNLYKIGELFNIPSFRINGYNVIEVYTRTKDIIENVRQNRKPAFIEAITYRWRGHVGPDWDLDKEIRSKEEVYWWVKNCSIRRFEKILLDEDILDSSSRKSIFKEIRGEIKDAVNFSKKSPYPKANELGDVFSS